MQQPDVQRVRRFLLDLQASICAGLEAEEDGPARFGHDEWTRADGGGGTNRWTGNGRPGRRRGGGT